MLIVDKLLIGGISFILRRVAAAVDAEMNDDSVLRDELLAAQMRLELGEIDEAEFAQVEEAVLAGMREIRARRTGGQSIAMAKAERERDGEPQRFAIETVEANLDRQEAPDPSERPR